MRAALVAMPWPAFNRPSIQLGTLKAYLDRHLEGVTVTAHHPYLEVAHAIGFDRYRQIAASSWAGEALYSGLLFPDLQPRAARLFAQEIGRRREVKYQDLQQHLQGQVEAIGTLIPEDCLLVGFTVCFSQLSASLLAAKRIKALRPHLPIVFGGSSCCREMAAPLLDFFPQIDFIIPGEGEIPLTELLSFLAGRTPFPSAGILSRSERSAATSSTGQSGPTIADLNTLPLPDFSDYFRELHQRGLSFIPQLPVEFSRGCWWNRCSFCNLNLQWQGYRHKRHDRMLSEVSALAARHRCLDFSFTDNALPPEETDFFFQKTLAAGKDFRFFAEIRAMRRPADYAAYRRGGLIEIQVGIEALSDTLLRRMNKGTTVMDNIAAMKAATAAGIRLMGNLILEFPDSSEQEAEETLRALEAVLPYHPLQAATFFLGLASPIHREPETFGISAVTPHPKNKALYPAVFLDRAPLLVQACRGDRLRQRRHWHPVRKKLSAWSDFHRTRHSLLPALTFRDGGDFLLIRQERPGAQVLHHRLTGTSRRIYLRCSHPVRKTDLLSTAAPVSAAQLASFLDDLAGKHLLFQDHERCLALAIPSP